MPEPIDPRTAAFYMCHGSAITLTTLYDVLSEIQILNLDNLWEPGSEAYQAAADTIEGIKVMVALHQNKMVAKSQQFLE